MAAAAQDPRGLSLVEKHKERMQAEKEHLATQYLTQLAPHISKLVRHTALELCEFEAEAALKLIQDFETAHGDKITAWAERRRDHLFKLEAEEALAKIEMEKRIAQQRGLADAAAAAAVGAGGGGGRGGRSASGGESSSSGSESDDSASSDGDRGRSHRSSKHKKEKKGKKSKRSKKGKKEKREKRDRKDKEKDRKDKEKKRKREAPLDDYDENGVAPPGLAQQFGRFGIVREADLDNKRPEFTLWALEVKQVHTDNLPQREEKELFRDFMEDYNTATFPHKKYYNLAKWEHEMRAKKAREAGPSDASRQFVLDDEAALRTEIEERRRMEQEERLRQTYMELKTTTKADDMRHQEQLKSRLALAYKTGDTKTVELILDKLRADDDKYKGRAGVRPAPK